MSGRNVKGVLSPSRRTVFMPKDVRRPAVSETTKELERLVRDAMPEPWKWMQTPSAHSLDYPQGTPDKEWDGTDDEYLAFDELKAADGGLVLTGVWCNDSTAVVGPANATVAKLLALAPALAREVLAGRKRDIATRKAVQWVIEDMGYKAPELYQELVPAWWRKLNDALAAMEVPDDE